MSFAPFFCSSRSETAFHQEVILHCNRRDYAENRLDNTAKHKRLVMAANDLPSPKCFPSFSIFYPGAVRTPCYTTNCRDLQKANGHAVQGSIGIQAEMRERRPYQCSDLYLTPKGWWLMWMMPYLLVP